MNLPFDSMMFDLFLTPFHLLDQKHNVIEIINGSSQLWQGRARMYLALLAKAAGQSIGASSTLEKSTSKYIDI